MKSFTEPERSFVILTAYFDESGTHGGSPATIMAGIMGNACQWSRFRRDINALKLRYGFSVFHAKEFKARQRQFSGWPDHKCSALLDDFFRASGNLMEAVTCSLSNSEYEQHYRGDGKPGKLRLDSKYGICFRYGLTHLIIEAVRRLGHHKKFGQTTMCAVLESGHKNAGDAKRIFHEIREELDALGFRFLSTITFAGKNDGDPLMVADFLAHGTFMLEAAGRNEPEASGYTGPRLRGTGMTHLKFEGDGLATLRAQLVQGMKKGGGWKATFLDPSPSATQRSGPVAGRPS